MNYDSTEDTQKHIQRVQQLINLICTELQHRGSVHDKTKLESHEKEVFDEMTPKLKGSTYGSEEYKDFLKQMAPALEHHYTNNSHHPEFVKSKEIWKDLPDFENLYEISSFGQIRSMDKIIKRGKQGDFLKKGKLLKQYYTPKKYLRVQLQTKNKINNYMVHQLVATTFIPNPLNKPQVNHKNGVKYDNRVVYCI